MSQRACASCGTANESDARFCEGCGTPLERTCGACGVPASATARFCRSCGTALDEKPSASQAGPTRKTVTVLFADLAGSTAFEEIVDAETAREVIGRYHDLLRSTAEHHRAGVTKYIGDGFMAVWGVPEIGADDAEHAVEAAVELQERFVALAGQVADAHGVDLALRVAVNTGEVVVGAEDADLVGDALNVGARLESECPHGRVVVGEETWRSTRGRHRYEPLGAVPVKGRQAAVPVYRWLGSAAAEAISFVGRGDELQRLRRVFDNAVAARGARLVTVTGDPGVGKTRLAAEFARSLPGARVIEVRCAVEGSPALAPVVEVLRPRDLEAEIPAGTADRDRMLRDLTGMTSGVPGSVEETFWALRRFVEVLAVGHPLLLIFDDIQWADSLLLDFIEHLAEWVRGAPVLMIALARPELRETRPDLVTVGGWVTEAVRLRGLEAGATAELAGRVLGSDRLPEELLRRLPTSTGGNPLFVRELVGMLVHDGVLAPKPDGWRLTMDANDIDVPPTIQALLASRLERLKAADRRVLEVASVIGTDFAAGAVAELAGLREAEITAALNRLRRIDLAEPSGTYAGDEAVWRFHHVLIRDVAYRRLLKSERADLHERLANWVEADGSNLAFESDEVVARNLEAAQGYRADLGLRDAHSAELALRSARSYLSSARRALDRDELVSAGTQAARGAGLAAGDTALHAELLLVGCEAFLSAGDVSAGSPLVDDLERIAGEALAPWAICYRCQLVVYTEPSRLPEADERLQEAIDEFARRGDAAGLAKAHRVRANARARLGRIGDCEMDLFEALIAARRGGDHRQITAALGAAPNAALWGPSPAPKAGGRCLDVVRMQRMTTAAPSLEATSLRCLAVLELLRGRPDKARSMLADARQVVADLGLRHGLMETELFAGIIELMVGDAVAAEPHFRAALEGLDALGVGADAGQAAALLARSVLAQGRVDEADRYAAESERIAGHNLKTAIGWRAVRAEILSARGRHEAAIATAREAVAVAADTDLVLDHADACLALSRVLAAAGDEYAATQARRDAEALYAAKDAVFLVGRTADVVPNAAAPQTKTTTATSRLTVSNRASRLADVGWQGLRDHDPRAVAAIYSSDVFYDDQRSISGDSSEGKLDFHSAAERLIADYPNVEWNTRAVRGETLALIWARLWDDVGNESASFNLLELASDGLVGYHGRFDGDDFEGAYREMEARYYAGEGAAFAENGHAVCVWSEAVGHRDREAARRVSWPDFRWLASPSSLKPEERSVDQFFDWLDERAQQLSTMRSWVASIQWLTPNCFAFLTQIQGAGPEGDEYRWEWIHVSEYRDGLAVSVREFAVDDEDAAFDYAESLVASTPRRLVVANAASRLSDRLLDAFRAKDVGAAMQELSEDILYEERRAFAGGLIVGIEYLRESVPALLAQYDHFEGHTLAVRGDRLCLVQSRWWDDDGNTATNLHVGELGEDGRLAALLYFDGEDFWSAYRELDARYYAGEGAAYARNGHAACALTEAMNQLDAEAARRLCRPEFRWLSTVPSLVDPVRSIDEVVLWWRQRAEQVASIQNWTSANVWLSTDVAVTRGEACGISSDGAEYAWSNLYVSTARDGLIESICAFEVDQEDAAFAYAESLVAQKQRRLVVANAASRVSDRLLAACQANDLTAAMDQYSSAIVYEDRRPLSGALVAGIDYLTEVVPALLEQYDRFQGRTIAVRGDRLCLMENRWSDSTGNEAANLHLFELGEDGRIAGLLYFEGDDFRSAYRELENRYYAGEGAAYADQGLTQSAFVEAMDQLDLAAARQLCRPEFRWSSPTRALAAPVRTIDEVISWWRDRAGQVDSLRNWTSAITWMSSEVAVSIGEAQAISGDGADYSWSGIFVAAFREGLFESVVGFEPEDEDAAFAYAESLVAQCESRLKLSNRASVAADGVLAGVRAKDGDAASAFYAERITYDDRRSLPGVPVGTRAEVRDAACKTVLQYSNFENRNLAVRGESLALTWSRWSDGTGNQTTHLHLFEVDDDGRIAYEGRFDEDDFWSAYRELENRYFNGEGVPYAASGGAAAAWVIAISNGDIEGARCASHPDFRWYATQSALKDPERTVDDMFRWWQERGRQVSSQRHWVPVLQWLSPTCGVGRFEIAAVGIEGEAYGWNSIYVAECRDGLLLAVREFDDEDSAFAYAESVVTKSSRLSLMNASAGVARRVVAALRAGDLDTVVDAYADDYVHADHRRLSGEPLTGRASIRDAWERIVRLYNRFEIGIIAARGERMHLARYQWSDDSGNQSVALILNETDEGGRIVFQDRFDEDDFAAAYAELDRRYYAGEGAAFAKEGVPLAEILHAENRGDLESTFKVFATPGLQVESRSGSVFPNRTAVELRHSVEELAAMVTSYRVWSPSFCWLAENWVVGRHEREAVGPKGEKFTWARLYVIEARGGLIASICEFDVDDEDAAFAYAEGLATQQPSRLSLSNSASRVADQGFAAMRADDAETAIGLRSRALIYDDRRRIAGGLVGGIDHLSAGLAMLVAQYRHFEHRTLAARGERLWLGWSRWSDDAGNEADHLHLIELGADGLIAYEARFDEDDFEAAYSELEHRYFAGEGAPYAEAGAALTGLVLAESRGDLDSAFTVFSAPGLRIENRSRSFFPSRSADELRRSVEELGTMVESYRVWGPSACWLSDEWMVGRHAREAVGSDGEKYEWSRIYVARIQCGLFTHLCEFDVEDEDAAFAYAEEQMRLATSRLPLVNHVTSVGQRFIAALHRADLDAAAAVYSDQVVYDDRRHLSGNAIRGASAVQCAIERFALHYNRFELKTIAIRGDRLQLAHHRWSDDGGNQATGYIVAEIGDDGRVIYDGRFDEDDFDAAYSELENRYYAGEGAEFAESGLNSVRFFEAMDALDVEAARGVCLPTFGWFSPPSTLAVQERSLDEFFEWLRERAGQVSSVKNFGSVARWLSPSCFVALGDVLATGSGGEQYAWTRIYVGEFRDGLLSSMRQFDDEDAAFAYAEERVYGSRSRLAVRNRASETAEAFLRAMQSHDIEAALALVADDIRHIDHRRLSGDPIHGKTASRVGLQRILKQYSRFEVCMLAVRGDLLALYRSRWFDDSGNETTYLHVVEVGVDGRIVTDDRFDEDDFDRAYRELEERYYAGEGTAFAEPGHTAMEVVSASNAGDLDKVFGEFMSPHLRVDSRSGTIFPDRTIAEFRDSVEAFRAMVTSSRIWFSAIRWMSPTCAVGRQERDAVGPDGETYTWTRIYVTEFDGGLVTTMCDFDLEFEDQAFAYAEERVREALRRLSLSNRASTAGEAVMAAMRAHDADRLVEHFTENFMYDDRRRLSGGPITSLDELRNAAERIFLQYNAFEGPVLAVRGEKLALGASLWSDAAGNEAGHLHLIEIDEDGLIDYQARFDEDDFEGACTELEHRYYTGEAAKFAEPGLAVTEYITVKNRGDLDTLFRDLSTPDVHIESRSRSVFLDRSATEYRASLEELNKLVGSVREWLAVVEWMSPRCCVALLQREAIGDEGEQYEWTCIVVIEIRGGRFASACQFEREDEDDAFAYAQEQVQAAENPLPAKNRASKVATRVAAAMQERDVGAVVDSYSDHFAFDDRRRWSGAPLAGKAALRAAVERMLQQYRNFEHRILAVRGTRLSLAWSRWTDSAGNQTAFHHLYEVDDIGQVARDTCFDEDDFDAAYRELEARFYAGEGAAFAEYGGLNTDYMMTMNRGDFDTVFHELTSAELRFGIHARSVFAAPSAAELRTHFEDLYAMLASVRSWFSALRWVSPTVYVGRLEREGVGHDGERFAWTWILVNEYRDGRLVSICEFDEDDEDSAFAYAEERVRDTARPLAVTNRAAEVGIRMLAAMRAHDVDATVSHWADQFVYDDRRHYSGGPLKDRADMRLAVQRIFDQYNRFETRFLAVRGSRISLTSHRWSDDAGNQSSSLIVAEVSADGRIIYEARFDEDDFENAYRELEARYYAGEGAAFAEYGQLTADYVAALNRGDFETAFGELTDADLELDNRSRSAFPNRSAAEVRAALEELSAMVSSVRSWFSAIRWLPSQCMVVRMEREAVGDDGEHFAWARILVGRWQDGKLTLLVDFDAEDDAAALAYAEELAAQT